MRSGRSTTPLSLKYFEPDRFYRPNTPEENFIDETEKKIVEGAAPEYANASFFEGNPIATLYHAISSAPLVPSVDYEALESRIAAAAGMPVGMLWDGTTTGRMRSSRPNSSSAPRTLRDYAKDDAAVTRQMYYYMAGYDFADREPVPIRGRHAHMVAFDDALEMKEAWDKVTFTYGYCEDYSGQSSFHDPPRSTPRRAERRPRRQETPRLRSGQLVQLQAKATQCFKERRR